MHAEAHSALTGPTRPYSAPLSPNRPRLGLSLEFESQCMPNPSPTPLSPNRPCFGLLGLGPNRPHAAYPCRQGLVLKYPSPTPLSPTGPPRVYLGHACKPQRALLGPTPARTGPTWPILVARDACPTPPQPHSALLGPRPHAAPLAYPCSQGLVLD